MPLRSDKFNTRVNSQGKEASSRGETVKKRLTKNRSTSTRSQKDATRVLNIVRPSTKTAAIYDPGKNREKTIVTHEVESKEENQNIQNTKTKTNSEVVEPLSVFTFKEEDLENLQASLDQALFEDRISLEFGSRMIKKVQQNQENVFTEVKKSVDKEVKDSEVILDLIDDLNVLINNFDKSLNERDVSTIAGLAKKNYENLNPDKLRFLENYFTDLSADTFLKTISKNSKQVDLKTNTSVVIQLLQLASYTFSLGIGPVICNEKLDFGENANQVSSNVFIGKTNV